jgi:hypothetical protein
MQTSTNECPISFRTLRLGGLLAAGVITLAACGGGGGKDDDDDITGPRGIQFTQENRVEAAALGVTTLGLFPALSEIATVVMASLETPGISSTDLMICPGGGQAILDADENAPEPGSAATLTFIECNLEGDLDEPALIDGTISINFTQYDESANLPNPFSTGQLTIDLTIDEVLDGEPVTGAINGGFFMRGYRNAQGDLGFRYGGPGDQISRVSVSGNGSPPYRFACFDVSVLYPDRAEEGYLLGSAALGRTFGVAMVADQVFTVAARDGGQPSDLDFQPLGAGGDDVPVSGGGLNYFPFVLGDDCAPLDIVGGVSGGAGFLSLYPTAEPDFPGQMTLELYDAPPWDGGTLIDPIQVSWEELD